MKNRGLTYASLIKGLCAFIAAISIVIGFYCTNEPQKTDILIQIAEEKNALSRGNEARIFYIEVDGKLIDLKQFKTSSWNYDGTLVSYGNEPISLTLESSRSIKISLKQGMWTPIVRIITGERTQRVDLYSENDGSQYIHHVKTASFWNKKSLFAFIGVFGLVYGVLQIVFRSKRLSINNKYLSYRQIAEFILIFSAVMIIMSGCWHTPWSRSWISMFDTSVFISIGKLINEGLIVFKEAFDHKGPIFLWLEALGCMIWYPYGVWVLESILQLTGYLFCYKWLKLRFSPPISLWATIFTIINSTAMVNIGNYSETWSLPFCFIALYIFSIAMNDIEKINAKWVVLCGSLCCLVLLMKPNCIVPWVVGVLSVLWMNIRPKNYVNLLKQAGLFLCGNAIILIPTCFYFIINDAFADFINATFIFNFQYSQIKGAGLRAKITGLVQLLESFEIICLNLLMPIAIIGEGLRLHLNKLLGKLSSFEFICWINLLLYIIVFCIMNGISGRSYSHYGVIFLPAVALIISYSLEITWSFLKNIAMDESHKILLLSLAYLFCIKGGFSTAYNRIINCQTIYPSWNIQSLAAANYIEANTQSDEKYGVWGDGLYIQTIINRLPASRFFYPNQEDIMPQNYDFGLENTESYLSDLEVNQPQYFVAYNNREMPNRVSQYILENYVQDTQFFSGSQLNLYVRKD